MLSGSPTPTSMQTVRGFKPGTAWCCIAGIVTHLVCTLDAHLQLLLAVSQQLEHMNAAFARVHAKGCIAPFVLHSIRTNSGGP